MKKLLIQLASGLVLDVLLIYARQQLNRLGSETHVVRWTTIVDFLEEMKSKGLPL